MSNFFLIPILLAMFAALAALLLGLFSMVKGGDFNKKYSNKLMQARVILQGLALFFLGLAWFFSR